MKFNCILLLSDDGINNFSNYRMLKKLEITTHIQIETNEKNAIDFICDYSLINFGNAPELMVFDLRVVAMNNFSIIENLALKGFNNKEKIKILLISDLVLENEITSSCNMNIVILHRPLTPAKIAQHCLMY